MTVALDPRTIDRLAKLLGMLGSAHDGERANAAALADKLVRELGLTWADIIAGNLASLSDEIAFALNNVEALSMWERGFLYSIRGYRTLTPKQRDVLDRIVAKVKASRSRAAA